MGALQYSQCVQFFINKKRHCRSNTAFSAELLNSALNLIGTEASGTSVHVARSTVHNGLDPLYIGLPGPIGTSVGVGDLNTKGNALITKFTLRHSAAPPIESHKFDALQTGALI